MLIFESHETNAVLAHWSNSFTQWILITVKANYIMVVNITTDSTAVIKNWI